MRFIVLCFIFLAATTVAAQDSFDTEKNSILSTMENQEQAWNRGDLQGFMNGYWRSDSLTFIGSKGITYGWEKTLRNYQSSYPDKEAMGELSFDVLSLDPLCGDVVLVIGKWKLTRSKDTLKGFYSLIWKKINDQWVIVKDHSS